jgi:hypothetical protein
MCLPHHSDILFGPRLVSCTSSLTLKRYVAPSADIPPHLLSLQTIVYTAPGVTSTLLPMF